jgi:hypothetical protein
MRTLTMLVALMLAACSGCEKSKNGTEPAPLALEVVSVEFGPTWYRLVVRITGASTVQELRTFRRGQTDTVVEYFEVPADGWREDIHADEIGAIRDMLIYPATVAGCDIRNGFAMLPANMDGTFITNETGALLTNEDHGQIVGTVASADMARAIRWRTEARADGLLVTIDGVDHWFPKP